MPTAATRLPHACGDEPAKPCACTPSSQRRFNGPWACMPGPDRAVNRGGALSASALVDNHMIAGVVVDGTAFCTGGVSIAILLAPTRPVSLRLGDLQSRCSFRRQTQSGKNNNSKHSVLHGLVLLCFTEIRRLHVYPLRSTYTPLGKIGLNRGERM
jgi:hypothetical protein